MTSTQYKLQCKLSVNVNKLATLRNARGKNSPDVLQGALDCLRFGAHGITVHPRPDERHIRKQDVFDIAEALRKLPISAEFNIEGFPDSGFLSLIEKIRPAQATLVPDPPHVLTSNAGFRPSQHEVLLKSVLPEIKAMDVRTSVFVDPAQMQASDFFLLREWGADRIELYTESYAVNFATAKSQQILAIYQNGARLAAKAGLAVNAGHDLNLENLREFARAIPELVEVSIGHALICDALNLGLEKSVKSYLACLD